MPARRVSFASVVEAPEPMHGLQIPDELVSELGGGKRPRVVVTVNDHTWRTRVAIMRGRNLIGLSIANRTAAGVAIGDTVDVTLAYDDEPQTLSEPNDLTAALDADPADRAAFDALSFSRRRAHVHAVETAKRAETRQRRIQAVIDDLRSRQA